MLSISRSILELNGYVEREQGFALDMTVCCTAILPVNEKKKKNPIFQEQAIYKARQSWS